MIRNYFTDLEIEPTLDLERVKAAHRRMAKKYHPDVNHQDEFAAEKFRRAQEAFERLNSEEKMRIHKKQIEELLDIFVEIEVSESAWDEGVAVIVPLQLNRKCPSCANRTCSPCQGRGIVEIQRGAHRWTKTCEQCSGSGRSQSAQCSKCRGAGHVLELETIRVNLQDFDEATMSLRISQAGKFAHDNRRRGDLVLRAKIRGL